jgi:hypothetical protein
MSAACPLLGFIVCARPRAADANIGVVTEALLGLLEANDLVTRSRRPLEFEITREGSQATHADRELVLAWAQDWERVADIEVSDLVDFQR